MSREDEDDLPRRWQAETISRFEIGQAIDDLSLEELALCIEMLQCEIARLEQMRRTKEASRAGAEAFFKI